MIHPIISINYCSSSEFPTVRVLFHEMQTNNTHIQINPNTHFEKNFQPPLRPLNFSSSPLSTIKTSSQIEFLHSRFFYTSVGDRVIITNLEQPLFHLLKTRITLFICFVALLLPLHREIFTEHTSLYNSLATHSSYVQQQHTHPKQKKMTQTFQCHKHTTASPFSALPCLHTVESKHYQPPTGKKHPSLKTLKPLSVDT